MNPNKDWLETYKNRVSEFEKKEIKKPLPKAEIHSQSFQNPYAKARVQVLANCKEGRRIEIMAMERDGNINNRWYDQFIADILFTAGDVPSLALRNRIKGI